MKKRLACAALSAALLLGLCGCGAGRAEGRLPETDPDEPYMHCWDPPPGYAPGAADDGGGTGGDPARETGTEPAEGPGTEPAEGPGTEPAEGPGTEPAEGPGGASGEPGTMEPVPGGADANPVWFEEDLQRFLENDRNWSGKSYMASPASFRAALCLAIEGAGGDTREALLDAAKFRSYGAMENWYRNLLDAKDGFDSAAESLRKMSEEYGDGSDPGMSFDIANGLWDNSTIPGSFRKEYAELMASKYGASVGSSPADRITDDVNAWAKEKTRGMIDNLGADMSGAASVLANAIYVKSGWTHEFYEGATEKGTFAKADGSTVELDFMRQTEDFLYSEDGGRQYAAFPLDGGLWLTVCTEPGVRALDLYSAMHGAESRKLDVKMPKLDLETSFDGHELYDFLQSRTGGLLTSDTVDFTAMTDDPGGWTIGDAVQKTRLKTDEKGMEAAAVTVLMMTCAASIEEPEIPVEFHMDKPFTFLITDGLYKDGYGGAGILFFGQFMG